MKHDPHTMSYGAGYHTAGPKSRSLVADQNHPMTQSAYMTSTVASPIDPAMIAERQDRNRKRWLEVLNRKETLTTEFSTHIKTGLHKKFLKEKEKKAN